MFVLSSHITIGKYTFSGVNDLRITKGIHSDVDTALIRIPTTGRLKRSGNATESIDTARTINRGDTVTIKVGYDGQLKSEFVGFVSRINFSTPCEIECEGYSFLLRTKNVNTTFPAGSGLVDVCSYLVKDTGINLSHAIPDTKLGSALSVSNQSATKVLDYIKDNFKYSVYFNGDTLYVGLQETELKGEVKYKLGWNTIKDNGLKYHLAEQTRVKVVLKAYEKDGGNTLYTVGDPDGEVHEHMVKHVAQSDLQHIAEGYLKAQKFTGYEGKITGFLQPYCEHGYSASIEDERYPERSGKYFVPSVEIVFGGSGGRRIVELSNRLDA